MRAISHPARGRHLSFCLTSFLCSKKTQVKTDFRPLTVHLGLHQDHAVFPWSCGPCLESRAPGAFQCGRGH